jgi:copper chaperone CopZ
MVLSVVLLGGCTRDGVEEKAKPTFMFWCFRKEIVSDEYKVPDMKTPAAAAYLQNKLTALPGYMGSTYDLASGTLTVRYSSSVIRKMNIEEAIAVAGFDVNGRPAHPNVKLPEGVK